MADKIVSWGGYESKGTSGMGVTGSLAVSGSGRFTDGLVSSRLISLQNVNNYISLAGGGGVFIDFRANDTAIARMSSGGMFIGSDTSPSARLHVKGAGTTSSTTSLLVQNANSSATMVVRDDGKIAIGANASVISGSDLSIKASTSIIQSTTTNMFLYLKAGDNNYTAGIRAQNSTGDENWRLEGNNSGTTKLNVTTGDLELSTTANKQITFKTLNTERLRITGDGNVGIGTASPTSKLYLDGGLFTKKYYTDTSANTVNFGSGYELFGTPHASSGYSFYINPTGWNSGWNFRIGDNSNYTEFDSGTGVSTSTVTTQNLNLGGVFSYYKVSPATGWTYASANGWDFVIRGTSDEKLRIKNTGNVLIGTTTDSARLTVKGSGTTSSTTSLLVQNSSGTTALSIADDTKVSITGLSSIWNCLYNASGVSVPLKFSAQYGATSSNNSALRFEFNFRESAGYWLPDYFQNILYDNTPGSVLTGFEWYTHQTQVGSSPSQFAMSLRGKTLSIGTNTPNASAILQADSTTQGFLPPRMTTAEKAAIASPAAGLMVYDTTLNQMSYYNGSTWVNF